MSTEERSEGMQARAGSVKEAQGCVLSCITSVTLPGLTGMISLIQGHSLLYSLVCSLPLTLQLQAGTELLVKQ